MGRQQQPKEQQSAGSQQAMMEVMACLVLRQKEDRLRIEASELQRLYDYFPQGFALAAMSDSDGGMIVGLVGETGLPLTSEVVAAIRAGERGLAVEGVRTLLGEPRDRSDGERQ